LFDSGSDSVIIPEFVSRDAKIDLTYRNVGVQHRYGQSFVGYRAPLEVVGFSQLHLHPVVTTVNVGYFLPALVPPQIYTPFWSIEFSTGGVRFLPKRAGTLPFKPTYDSANGIPDFTSPLLDFTITGEEEMEFEAVLDTGSSSTALLSHTTANKIGIERFPVGEDKRHNDPNDIHKYDFTIGTHYLPLTLGGFSFEMPTMVWNEQTNKIPTELLLAQGFRTILNERSADISLRKRLFVSTLLG
jgi:hypothetical protein